MVIGPTPPGTGVMAPAILQASLYSTSPISFPLDASRLMPTSMTVEPVFNHSPFMNSGRPTAAIRMSASEHTLGKSIVFEWQSVTVAFASVSNMAMGFPTMFERPTTTAFLPWISAQCSRIRRMQPLGVAATYRGLPWAKSPMFSG